jgi:protein SCO1/2
MRLGILIATAAVLSAKSYPVDGVVVATDPTARTILVAHRPIGNYMPAMTMPFRVEEAEAFASLHPGARITFDLVIAKDRSVARNIHKSPGADIEIPPPKERLNVGDRIADFELTDQQGRRVRLSEFRGEVVAINFIYTRCPLPDMCPRLAANFAALARRFENRDLVLLSVTVDPEYDTQAVLAEYAKRWRADGEGWRFLTGDVSRLAGQLGEVYWADEGSIGHNSMTSVISRDGRLAARVEGAGYRVDQLQALIAHELEKAR